jgi:hypothetical protein
MPAIPPGNVPEVRELGGWPRLHEAEDLDVVFAGTEFVSCPPEAR